MWLKVRSLLLTKSQMRIIEWSSPKSLETAMPKLISFLDTWREELEEITPELGVTDPISGSIVVEG